MKDTGAADRLEVDPLQATTDEVRLAIITSMRQVDSAISGKMFVRILRLSPDETHALHGLRFRVANNIWEITSQAAISIKPIAAVNDDLPIAQR